MLVTAPLSCCKILIYQQREVFACFLPSLQLLWQYCSHHATVQSKMLIEKDHWRLQPLYRPNQPSGKTWADHYIRAVNRPCGLRAHLKRIGIMESALSTFSRTVPSGRNRDAIYGRRMSQPPTSCGERRKTCAAPPNSWQHVDWGSKHGWSTPEEEGRRMFNHLSCCHRFSNFSPR